MLQVRAQRRWVGPRHAGPYPASWRIEDEDKVPESRRHHLKGDRLQGLFVGGQKRPGPAVRVGGNLALRWAEEPRPVGGAPAVYLVEPPPPEGDDVTSLRTWLPGHEPPLLAVEVVSPSRPDKDYTSSPDKYA